MKCGGRCHFSSQRPLRALFCGWRHVGHEALAMKMTYLKDVVTLRLDAAKCVGCGRCVEVCPHRVFVVEAHTSRIVERDACMECGACARNCPVDALWVKNGVGCAVGLLNAALGRKSACCGEEQACCCGDEKSK